MSGSNTYASSYKWLGFNPRVQQLLHCEEKGAHESSRQKQNKRHISKNRGEQRSVQRAGGASWIEERKHKKKKKKETQIAVLLRIEVWGNNFSSHLSPK